MGLCGQFWLHSGDLAALRGAVMLLVVCRQPRRSKRTKLQKLVHALVGNSAVASSALGHVMLNALRCLRDASCRGANGSEGRCTAKLAGRALVRPPCELRSPRGGELLGGPRIAVSAACCKCAGVLSYEPPPPEVSLVGARTTLLLQHVTLRVSGCPCCHALEPSEQPAAYKTRRNAWARRWRRGAQLSSAPDVEDEELERWIALARAEAEELACGGAVGATTAVADTGADAAHEAGGGDSDSCAAAVLWTAGGDVLLGTAAEDDAVMTAARGFVEDVGLTTGCILQEVRSMAVAVAGADAALEAGGVDTVSCAAAVPWTAGGDVPLGTAAEEVTAMATASGFEEVVEPVPLPATAVPGLLIQHFITELALGVWEDAADVEANSAACLPCPPTSATLAPRASLLKAACRSAGAGNAKAGEVAPVAAGLALAAAGNASTAEEGEGQPADGELLAWVQAAQGEAADEVATSVQVRHCGASSSVADSALAESFRTRSALGDAAAALRGAVRARGDPDCSIDAANRVLAALGFGGSMHGARPADAASSAAGAARVDIGFPRDGLDDTASRRRHWMPSPRRLSVQCLPNGVCVGTLLMVPREDAGSEAVSSAAGSWTSSTAGLAKLIEAGGGCADGLSREDVWMLAEGHGILGSEEEA